MINKMLQFFLTLTINKLILYILITKFKITNLKIIKLIRISLFLITIIIKLFLTPFFNPLFYKIREYVPLQDFLIKLLYKI